MLNRFLVLFALLTSGFYAKSQYFYKDIVQTLQNRDNWKLLMEQKVREVNIFSIDANNEMTPGFVCTQKIASDFSYISTFTKSANTAESTLTTFYGTDGKLIKTEDTSDTYKSITLYDYNEKGAISSLLNNSVQTDNQVGATEKHVWIYENGKIQRMLKIKGETDTTIVNLVKDKVGNIIEEKSVRGGQALPSFYYYYDSAGRLTDIVRYSPKAQRMLPDYVFEYDEDDRLISMIIVTAGSKDYQKWNYTYNASGLKDSETCFDKKKQLIVKINYKYNLN